MRTLKKLIKDNEPFLYSGDVAFCSLHSEKVVKVSFLHLTPVQLLTPYKESEWWIEDGDLCVCKDK